MANQQHAGVLVSESNRTWRPLPAWADFLIRLGHAWPASAAASRRVALVSMPCDSAAVGLLALGALVRDLGNPNANDLGAHFQALRRLAEQYLHWCKSCELRCDPELKGCGYLAEASGVLRRDRERYEIGTISHDPRWGDAIACVSKRESRLLLKNYAADWHIDGEPPLHSSGGELSLNGNPYSRIINSAAVVPDNLQRSFAGLCLATRVGGQNATRETCGSLRFQMGDTEYALDHLLSVHGWTEQPAVSRMTLFNARTDRFDRYPYAPSLVLADGDASFLRVLDRTAFQRSDVIGVVHRALDRYHLELVGNRMLELRQWYSEDLELQHKFASHPPGIALSILRQRAG
jgi:hypothetical protein